MIKTNMSRKFIVELVVLVVIAVAAVMAVLYQYEIRDWWVLRSYNPPAEIAALSERSDMSPTGERIFFASQPELNSADEFNGNCQFPDKSLVLGCYSSGRIYIYNVEDERLDGVKEVTAAHEMLHAVYERLSAGERERIDRLTEEAYESIENERIRDTVENYADDGHGTLSNELHSILGTEAQQLSVELESHYEEYFDERDTILEITRQYESVFVEIQEQIEKYDKELQQLKAKIEQTEAVLTKEQADLEKEASRLEQLRQNGQIAQYNQAVPGYNAAVNTYNNRINTYVETVERYNKLVKTRNQVALEQNSLVQSLDSQFERID